MDNKKIEELFSAAVKAKVEKSTALGTKATWSNDDQMQVAAQALYKATEEFKGEEGPDVALLVEVCKKTYNHSAFAQKLEKAFTGTGHFQREGKKKVEYADYMSELRKSMGM